MEEKTLKKFKKEHWDIFITYEKKLKDTQDYVDFNYRNYKTYSITYHNLLLSICAEIDNLAKEIAYHLDEEFKKVKKDNICAWGYSIKQTLPNIVNCSIIFNDDDAFEPWLNLTNIKKQTDKDGNISYQFEQGKKSPVWWLAYNNVKHARTSTNKDGELNFCQANLKNVVSALSALYSLNIIYLKHLMVSTDNFEENRLFKLSD